MSSTWRMRALGLVLSLTLLLPAGMTAAPLSSDTARVQARSQDFAGGSGTAADPYLVATAEHLDNVRNHLDAHFLQTADIDLGVAPWNQGAGWEPINTFAGVFDGGGHVIRNLTARRPDTTNQGLFGSTSLATLRDIHLRHVFVEGGSWTGGLVGSVSGAVDNASVTGIVVSGDGINIGGLAGSVGLSGAVHYAFADVQVTGFALVGGLAGWNAGEIRHSYALGSVRADLYAVGGLVGVNHADALISDSYSHASVEGPDVVGGLLGANSPSSGRVPGVYRSFSSGPVTGTDDDVGGLVGDNAGIVSESYWDVQTSGQTQSAGGEGRTTAQMQQQATYEFYNFNTLWTIDEGNDYPVFQDLTGYPPRQAVDIADLQGAGTLVDPYLITTPDELHAVRQDLAAHYLLANDIDMTASVVWDHGRGWEPIGTSADRFRGVFDGGGYTIRNLAVNRPASPDQGLFGYTESAPLGNVRLRDLNVLGGRACGGLSGTATGVADVSVTGHVLSASRSVGGLVGSGSNLERVHADVMVKGVSNVGGLAGSSGGNISQAYTRGSVQGVDQVGGLVGRYTGTQGNISDSYSRASVAGHEHVGGLVGSLAGGSVSRTYSTGAVTGDTDVGGLVGTSEGTVSDSYWDAQASGQTTSAGGAGRTTADMTSPYAANTFVGWDFQDTWVEDVDYAQNDGYPYLYTLDVTPADVEVEILGSNRMFPGQVIDYVLAYTNHRPEAVEDAVLVLRLPHAAMYRGSSADGLYWPQRHRVFWKLGDLAPDARGRVAVTVEYQWGIPGGHVVDMAALLVGTNHNPYLADLASYLDYVPVETLSTDDLSSDDWEDETADDAELGALYDQAVGDGYLWASAERLTLSDGTSPLRAILIHPEDESVRILYTGAERPFAVTVAQNLVTAEDTTGGATLNAGAGELSFWGDWDLMAGAAWPGTTVDLEACALAGGADCCITNCLNKAGWGIALGALGTKVNAALTGASCVVAIASRTGDSLRSCAASIVDLVADNVGTVAEAVLCVNECRADPNRHACTEDVRTCDPEGFDFWGLLGRSSQCVYPCEADGCYGRQTCQPCAARDCCENGRCVPPQQPIRVFRDRHIGGAAVQTLSAASASGGSDCQQCESDVPADPNEKYGPDGDLLPGQWVEYTIEYENVGTGEAYDVYILDWLDEAFDEDTLQLGGNASYYPGPRVIHWDIGTLAPAGQPGSTGEVTLRVRLQDGLPGGTTIVNQAAVYFPTVPEITPTSAVVNVIQPVVAEPQTLTTRPETPLAVTLSGRDVSDAPLTYRVVEAPMFGTLSGEPPNLTYTSMPGHSGRDRFSFVVNNGTMDSRPAQVYVTTTTSVYLPLVLRVSP